MSDSRHEIHDGLTQAAASMSAKNFDDALAEMTRLNNRFTIPQMPSLIDRARELKRDKDLTAEALGRIVEDMERVAKEMGPA